MEESGENWPSHLLMEINSNLEIAINYVSYLEERVRELEKQKKRSAEAVIVMSESQLCTDEGTALSCESSIDDSYGRNESLPEVKARALEKEVLIIIHCVKQKGIMHKILAQLENLQLSVVSSSVLPFGKFNLDITIVAQMGDECKMTVNGIVKSLRRALLK